MMTRGPKPIGDVLSELMARRGFARIRSAQAYDDAWREAAGPLAAEHTRVGSLRRGTLEVVVANSTLVQELVFQRPALLDAMARQLPDENIRDLRFRVGTIE
jgi:predicted nucleic acid-binding Zn ribbon protein